MSQHYPYLYISIPADARRVNFFLIYQNRTMFSKHRIFVSWHSYKLNILLFKRVSRSLKINLCPTAISLLFSPEAYNLPLEYTKLVAECSRQARNSTYENPENVWICKPVGQSQGRGILLFQVRLFE